LTELQETRRAQLVGRAAEEWKSALIDLTGRNNLLHYRDLQRGTLDLTTADPMAIGQLLLGKTVKVSSLFDDPDQLDQVQRRIRAIHNKAKENEEERGLATVSIAWGLATWANKRGTWTPAAPVLLQSVSLKPVGAAQDEFDLSVTGEMELNPTLLHVLRLDFGREFDVAALTDRIDGAIDELWELTEVYKWLSDGADGIPGFAVEPRIVLANFAYAKLEMVRDLEFAFDEMVGHDMISALAGDLEARAAIRDRDSGASGVPSPDSVALADEFLILDADSSQNYAVNAVLGGQNLIIKGPPGTGKSQTISNLIASLVARGKKVLFVAEKRAAIDAVTKRIGQQGLGDLVLDLHSGVSSRRAFAQLIQKALETSRKAPRPGNEAELVRVESRRAALNSYARDLHKPRRPWGMSAYQIQSELFGLVSAHSDIRFRGGDIERLDGATADLAAHDLAHYVDLGGLSTAESNSPWANSPIVSTEEVREADEILNDVRHRVLSATWELLGRACRTTGTKLPETLGACAPVISLWCLAGELASVASPAIYALDLPAEQDALASAGRGAFARLLAALTSPAYRAARARVRVTLLPGSKIADGKLLSCVIRAAELVRHWVSSGNQGHPQSPVNLAECQSQYEYLMQLLHRLESLSGRPGLTGMRPDACETVLDALDADRATLGKLPELHRLRANMESVGLRRLLAHLAAERATAGNAVRAFRYAWLISVFEHIALHDLSVGNFSAAAQDRTVGEYSDGDRDHVRTTAARIRRAYAERVVAAQDEFPDQAALVQKQASLKRRHMAVRDFMQNASDVLLALKPCWAMSPLVVSRLVPPRPYFDVVIFDEASQVTPADAVTSILRGLQQVVAGDDKQLPPTAFFSSASVEEESGNANEDDLASLLGGTVGVESILDALNPLVGFRMLTWHYRSRDERLIAFSNEHVYDRTLTTFPGANADQVLRHVPAPWSGSADTNSPEPEVSKVVELILEHARQRPNESLGVITMGIKHASRIEEAVRQRLRSDPQLAARFARFFDEDQEERFFVKNIERVQGDERDAIILSIGYGKNSNGSLVYRFGPLLTEGGERRLNVAVTRAKSRLTLVSSFSSHDMNPERSSAKGVQLLRQYLQYVESGGANLGDMVHDRPALNPFEIDVRDTLTRRGLSLTPQYGSSGYWIDFAVRHPSQPGRYVLAIECDGATYHSAPSARDRDRLRQEQLERLGWRFHRIWSTDWFRHKDACADKVVAAYERTLREADKAPGNSLKDAFVAPPVVGPPIAPVEQAPARNASLRPFLYPGQEIAAYSDYDLDRLARWIRSDDILRTEEELLAEMMRELGFQRRGKNVVARLKAAIVRTKG
jgi:very-short-patch-repair endonuclease